MAAPTYKAEQAKDGTWTIFQVPIFSVHVDKRGADPLVFSRGWLQKALKAAKTREAEGYYPPLHIRHHGDGDVEAAGKFRITHIAEHPHGGSKVPTLFADLVGVRPEVYERIRRGELSYRSVEILDIDSPELDSLALLDDEVPFFRYPLLKIGSEKKTGSKTPALAYRAQGDHTAFLFNYQEGHMEQQYTDENQKEMEAAPAWAAEMLKALSGIAKAVGVSKEEEEEEHDKGAEEEEHKAVDIDIDADGDEEEEEAKEEKAKRQASPVEVGMSQRAAFSAVTDEVRELRAELNRLQAEKRIDKEAAKLRATGMGEDRINSFMKTFKADGEKAALVYAKALKDMRPTEPPRQFSGELRYSEDPDPKAVASYAQKGPQALERARSLHRSFKATHPEMSLETYLEINMDPEAYFAKARANAGKAGN